jgi:hypothetical protein
MAKFMDVHHGMTGITDEQFEQAHAADLAIQSEEGVTFEHAWADPDEGVVYCLSVVDADQRPQSGFHVSGAERGQVVGELRRIPYTRR